MASTRLNNDKVEYCQQKRDWRLSEQFALYKYKCISAQSAIPQVGINMPMMTSGYNNNILSNNASDIESSLYGVGSTNLVTPKKEMTPRLKKLPSVSFFDRMQTVIPEPLVIQNGQRPKYL